PYGRTIGNHPLRVADFAIWTHQYIVRWDFGFVRYRITRQRWNRMCHDNPARFHAEHLDTFIRSRKRHQVVCKLFLNPLGCLLSGRLTGRTAGRKTKGGTYHPMIIFSHRSSHKYENRSMSNGRSLSRWLWLAISFLRSRSACSQVSYGPKVVLILRCEYPRRLA